MAPHATAKERCVYQTNRGGASLPLRCALAPLGNQQ